MYHFVVSRFAVTHFGVPLSADCGPMIDEMSVNKGGNPQVEIIVPIVMWRVACWGHSRTLLDEDAWIVEVELEVLKLEPVG